MKIDTSEQRANVLAKGLKPERFKNIRKLVCAVAVCLRGSAKMLI
jgi:hypothetical protein